MATCLVRIEPCNGVQENNKMRTTTDKSWPKLEVLPDGSDELAVNSLTQPRRPSAASRTTREEGPVSYTFVYWAV